MTITVTVKSVENTQGVANALVKTAAGILGDGTKLQQSLENGPQSGKLHDPNGNCVGDWKLSG